MSGAWIALFVALWGVVILMLVVVLGLIRKVAALQIVHGVHSDLFPSRPLPGRPIPEVAGSKQLASAWGASRSRVMLFLSSSCGACRKLAGQLEEGVAGRQAGFPPREKVDLIVVTDPGGTELFGAIGAVEILVQTAGEVSRAWSVPGTPFAVAVDATGVVRGSAFAVTVDQVRDLAGML